MTNNPRCIAYVSCSGGNCIDVLELDLGSGGLKPIERVALPGNGMPLAVAPDRQHLYAAIAASGPDLPAQYACYAIDRVTGRLNQLQLTDAPGRMSYITVDRAGRHLLGASVAGDLIASNRLQPDATIATEPTDIRKVPSKAHQITTDTTNSFAFVPNLGADIVMQMRFDETSGTFADNAPNQINLPAGAAPRHLAHAPDGRFAYLLNEENGTITSFALDAGTGQLTAVQTSSYMPDGDSSQSWGAQILITPCGRYLYASDRTTSTLSLHIIDPATGYLTKRWNRPTEQCPRNFAISNAGHHLIAAGEKSDRVACYAIETATGDLTETATIESGAGPLWIEIVELT